MAALAWRRTPADASMMGDAPGTMGMPMRVLRAGLFACGYLPAWSAGGLLAFVVMRPMEQGLDKGLYSSRAAAVAIFPMAGGYQLAPLRDLRAGALHRSWCLACGWAFMAVLVTR